MKKASSLLIAVPVILLTVFLSGFYIGRSTSAHTTSIVAVDSTVSTSFPQSFQAASPDTPSEDFTETTASHKTDFPIDINSAELSDLTMLPGIGEVLAGRIIAYREENGPFTDISQLLNVSGIGQQRLDAIQDLIYIGE